MSPVPIFKQTSFRLPANHGQICNVTLQICLLLVFLFAFFKKCIMIKVSISFYKNQSECEFWELN